MARVVMNEPHWRLNLGRVTDEAVEWVAEQVREDAGRFAPRGITGRLKRSFITVKPRPLARWVGSTVFYWRFVEKGTGRHDIQAGVRARSGRTRPHKGALEWPGMFGGPVQRVDHPGGTPNPHLKRALFRKRRLPRF